jgi:hypothetical protein
MKKYLFAAAFTLATSNAFASSLTIPMVVNAPTRVFVALYPHYIRLCETDVGDACSDYGLVMAELSVRGCRFSNFSSGIYYRWDCAKADR